MPSSFSFPLYVPPSLPATGPVLRPYATHAQLRSPLGFGLLAPLRRDGKGDFAATGGVELVKSCVAEILGIQGDSEYTQGELPWRTELGSLLYLLRHRRNDALLQAAARTYVADALSRFEPRVRLKSATFSKASAKTVPDKETVLILRLVYDIVTGDPRQVVVPNVEQTLEV